MNDAKSPNTQPDYIGAFIEATNESRRMESYFRQTYADLLREDPKAAEKLLTTIRNAHESTTIYQGSREIMDAHMARMERFIAENDAAVEKAGDDCLSIMKQAWKNPISAILAPRNFFIQRTKLNRALKDKIDKDRIELEKILAERDKKIKSLSSK